MSAHSDGHCLQVSRLAVFVAETSDCATVPDAVGVRRGLLSLGHPKPAASSDCRARTPAPKLATLGPRYHAQAAREMGSCGSSMRSSELDYEVIAAYLTLGFFP